MTAPIRELKRASNGGAEDVRLQWLSALPDSKGKRNVMSVIDRMTTFGASTASGLLIWH
jgi:hypothetical protein